MLQIWAPYHDSDKQTAQRAISKRAVYENMTVMSCSAQSFMILTEDDGIPGSKFKKEPEEYTVAQLKQWLKCRLLKQSRKYINIYQIYQCGKCSLKSLTKFMTSLTPFHCIQS